MEQGLRAIRLSSAADDKLLHRGNNDDCQHQEMLSEELNWQKWL